MKHYSNIPAFPLPRTAISKHDGHLDYGQQGMMLRDYFAAAVAPAVLQLPIQQIAGLTGVAGEDKKTIARLVYQWADALIEARAEEANTL